MSFCKTQNQSFTLPVDFITAFYLPPPPLFTILEFPVLCLPVLLLQPRLSIHKGAKTHVLFREGCDFESLLLSHLGPLLNCNPIWGKVHNLQREQTDRWHQTDQQESLVGDERRASLLNKPSLPGQHRGCLLQSALAQSSNT